MNGITCNVHAETSGIANDRVRVTISDATGEAKWCHLTPKAAHDLAIEILHAAFTAQKLTDFRVIVGITQ